MSGPAVLVGVLSFWLSVAALLATGCLLAPKLSGTLPDLEETEPASREALLWLWAGAPWLLSGALLGAIFLPSLLDWLGLVADHCHLHPGGAPHLCFLHASLPLNWVGSLLLTVAVLTLVGSTLVTAMSLERVMGSVRELRRWAHPESREEISWIATRRPVALTTGFWFPRSYISEGLREQLDPALLEVVLAHEEGHRRRRDGLRKLAVHALIRAYPQLPRAGLERAFDQVCEERCDAFASTRVGCGARVAAGLLRVERLLGGLSEAPPEGATAFQGGQLERRVQALLRTHWAPAPWRGFPLWLGTSVVGILLLSHPLHHYAETLLLGAGL